jgi:hypothetical protein
MKTEILLIGKAGPCCVCGPPARPTPGLKICVVTVADGVKFNLCKNHFRDFYVRLPSTCCAFGDCTHGAQAESAFTLSAR